MFPVLAQGALRVNLCPQHPVESNLVRDGHLIFRQTEQFCASLQSNVLLNFFFSFSGHAHSQFYARSRHRGEFKERIVTSSWPAVSSATWRAQRGEWWALICTCFFQLFNLVKVFWFIVVIELIFLLIFLFFILSWKKSELFLVYFGLLYFIWNKIEGQRLEGRTKENVYYCNI